MINYEEIGQRIGKLVAEKQKAYGDSYGNSGKILEILFPDGVKPEHYTELLAICRVVDKLFRLANDPEWGGESPWGDIVGYGLLRLGTWEKRQNEVPEKAKKPCKPCRMDENIHDSKLGSFAIDLYDGKVVKFDSPIDTCRSSYDPALRDSGLG
jgi:hypothetical protein